MLHDPEEATAVTVPSECEIPAATTLGITELTVSDLERSVAYWAETVGLSLRERGGDFAVLGTRDAPLIELRESSGTRPSDGYSGLYHVALLVPRRHDLARWLAHAARDRVPMAGLSDHFVSEALYLRDPDHHGIEIYWDRPRELWEGLVGERMTTLPLNVDDLLSEFDDPEGELFEGLPEGTVTGHVHLRVADVPEAVKFYRDVVGFGEMARIGDHAGFLSAGGYHHHLGMNSWESAGRRQPPNGHAVLRRFTVVVPDVDAIERVAEHLADAGADYEPGDCELRFTDPSGNPVELKLDEPRRT